MVLSWTQSLGPGSAFLMRRDRLHPGPQAGTTSPTMMVCMGRAPARHGGVFEGKTMLSKNHPPTVLSEDPRQSLSFPIFF